MTTTTEAVTRTCRHCGEEIKPSTIPGFWYGSDGTHWCAANKVDSAIHEPGCPDSTVVDQILTWAEVCEGDLVLWAGQLTFVELKYLHLLPEVGERVHIRFTGERNPHFLRPGDYTAVRRYVTEEDGNG